MSSITTFLGPTTPLSYTKFPFALSLPAPALVINLAVTKESKNFKRDSGIVLNEDEVSEMFGKLALSITPPMSRIQQPEPKVVFHLIRHAQAEHNLPSLPTSVVANMFNPTLTFHGYNQCCYLQSHFPYMHKITHVLCSPLRRTLETALISFKPLYDRGLKIIAWEQLREWGKAPCNTGDQLETLKSKVAFLPVDLQLLFEGWEHSRDVPGDKLTRVNHVKAELYAFGQAALHGTSWKGVSLGNSPALEDVEILVVSHGSFLRSLTGAKPSFHNTQLKSFEFPSGEAIKNGAEKLALIETQASKESVHFRFPEFIQHPNL